MRSLPSRWLAMVCCLLACNARALVLDFSTFYGGSGDANFATDVGVDAAGKIYVVGQTNSGDAPTTNAFQSVTRDGDSVNQQSQTFVIPSHSALSPSTPLGTVSLSNRSWPKGLRGISSFVRKIPRLRCYHHNDRRV